MARKYFHILVRGRIKYSENPLEIIRISTKFLDKKKQIINILKKAYPLDGMVVGDSTDLTIHSRETIKFSDHFYLRYVISEARPEYGAGKPYWRKGKKYWVNSRHGVWDKISEDDLKLLVELWREDGQDPRALHILLRKGVYDSFIIRDVIC